MTSQREASNLLRDKITVKFSHTIKYKIVIK